MDYISAIVFEMKNQQFSKSSKHTPRVDNLSVLDLLKSYGDEISEGESNDSSQNSKSKQTFLFRRSN
jgi:hypothetical protein